MSWWDLTPALLASAALFVLPGTAALRLVGVRGLYAWAGGPAVGAAILGLGAIALGRLGVPWTLASVLGLVALSWAAAALVGWAGRRVRFGWGPDATRAQGLAVAGSVAIVTLFLAWSMKAGMARPDALLQQWDGVFHLNAVATVRDTGNASSLGGLSPMYGDGGRSIFYPAVWHSVVAVTPWASIPAAANASSLVLGAGVWTVGLAGLARAAFPSRALVAMLAPVLAAAFITFPSWTFSTSGQWPNGYSVALLPGVCALVVLATRSGRSPWQYVVGLAVAAVAALGAVLAHGSAVFALVALLSALVVGRGVRALVRQWRGGHAITATVLGALGVAAAVLVVVVAARTGAFDSVLNYDRPGRMSSSDAWKTTLLAFPPAERPLLSVGLLAVIVVGIAGTFVLKEGRWLVVSLLAVVCLVVLAAGPENAFRWLSGFWYRSHVRISALLPIPAAPLGAVGISVLATGAARVLRRSGRLVSPRRAAVVKGLVAGAVVALLLVSTSGLRAGERRDSFAAAYQPGVVAWGTMVTPQEREMLDEMDTTLPDDAVLLGEALTGAAYAYALAGVPVVFPQIGGAGSSDDQTFLREHFRDIHEDPRVCEIVRRLGVTHFYSEPPAQVQGTSMGKRSPGLFDVDTSTGFVEVLSSDVTTVYQITACEDVQAGGEG
jgi:hypothetical protein